MPEGRRIWSRFRIFSDRERGLRFYTEWEELERRPLPERMPSTAEKSTTGWFSYPAAEIFRWFLEMMCAFQFPIFVILRTNMGEKAGIFGKS